MKRTMTVLGASAVGLALGTTAVTAQNPRSEFAEPVLDFYYCEVVPGIIGAGEDAYSGEDGRSHDQLLSMWNQHWDGYNAEDFAPGSCINGPV